MVQEPIPQVGQDAEMREKQRTIALMEIAAALKTVAADVAELRAAVTALVKR